MKMVIGGKYNWKHQAERFVYLGMGKGGSAGWHQFALVAKPETVWCEVLDKDLHMLEETALAMTNSKVTREQVVPFEAWFRKEIGHPMSAFDGTMVDAMRRAYTEAHAQGFAEGLEAAAKEIPTSWLDPALSGKDAVCTPPYGCHEIEALLLEIGNRIHALKGKQP